ncbi:basic proline-rich protein-like [Falco biarmicus]|uniref:basic proline-rich protein-like n=1 Tax=Falco biarmicus TaxID=345155 RepID=UPI0024BCBE9D|nr:basic proline-rich protein-like [Falco biarmicus]
MPQAPSAVREDSSKCSHSNPNYIERFRKTQKPSISQFAFAYVRTYFSSPTRRHDGNSPARGRAQGPGGEGTPHSYHNRGAHSGGSRAPQAGGPGTVWGRRRPARPRLTPGPGAVRPPPFPANPAPPAKAACGTGRLQPGQPGSPGARNRQGTARSVSSPPLLPPPSDLRRRIPPPGHPTPPDRPPATPVLRPHSPAACPCPRTPAPRGPTAGRSGAAPGQARPGRGAKRELPVPPGAGAAVPMAAAGPAAARGRTGVRR